MSTAKDHDRYEALRAPGYAAYLIGGVISSIGAEIQATAVGYELFRRTKDPFVLGLTGLMQFLPVFLFVLPAGQVADHFNRRKVFQCAQLLAASVSVALAWLSWADGPVPVVLSCLFVSGIARAFSAPSRSSLLSQIVPRQTIPNAVTWNSSGWQLANAVGPMLCGAILALFRLYSVAYLTACGCALVCVTLLFFVHPDRTAQTPQARSISNLLAGVRFVFANGVLLAAISLDLFAVLLGGAVALLPVYAEEILRIDEFGFGCLRAAPAFGAVIMAISIAHRPPLRSPGAALLLAVAGFGLATIVFGFSTSPFLSFLMLLLTGALDNISVVVRGTLMQVMTPDEMRGRVSAVNSLFISSSNELGAYESGQVAALFGTVFSVVSGGVGTIVVVLITWMLCPRLARLGPLHQLKPEPDSLRHATDPPPSETDILDIPGDDHVRSNPSDAAEQRRPEGRIQGFQEAIETDPPRRGIEP